MVESVAEAPQPDTGLYWGDIDSGAGMAKSRTSELLEAHVAFELGQWQGGALQAGITDEVAAFCAWSETLTLNQITSAARIQQVARERVLAGDLPEELSETINAITRHLIDLPVNKETRVQDVVDDRIFDAGVDLAIELRHLRQEIIGQAVESPLYAMLVAEILYNGIKSYLSATAKMASGSKLLSKGTKMLSKGLSVLDDQMEKRLRSWIEENSGTLARQSRKFLDHALTDERIREVAEEVWKDARRSRMSISEALHDGDIEAISEFSRQAWLHLRETEYVRELTDEGIAEFFRRSGDTPVIELLAMVGLNQEILEREAQSFAPRLVEAARESGALEAMIRRRLRPFYESDQAAALLG